VTKALSLCLAFADKRGRWHHLPLVDRTAEVRVVAEWRGMLALNRGLVVEELEVVAALVPRALVFVIARAREQLKVFCHFEPLVCTKTDLGLWWKLCF